MFNDVTQEAVQGGLVFRRDSQQEMSLYIKGRKQNSTFDIFELKKLENAFPGWAEGDLQT